jgi:hypothetical protein
VRAVTPFTYDDGGRAAAGFKGTTGDCVCRAIAIATRAPYGEVYRDLNARTKPGREAGRRSGARTGVPMAVIHDYLRARGWYWVPTMRVGQGTTTHLRADELPSGRLIVRLSRHLTAVIDGVVHDNHDPSRDGTRCVYGYWAKA